MDDPPAILFDKERKLISNSPYRVTWNQLKTKFATNAHRKNLALHFEQWILACKAIVKVGDIWIGGSFCSDAETPKDIDAVLFYRYATPFQRPEQRDEFLAAHANLMSNAGAKQSFSVDCATVSLEMPAQHLVRICAHWTMILSNGPHDERRAFYKIDGSYTP